MRKMKRPSKFEEDLIKKAYTDIYIHIPLEFKKIIIMIPSGGHSLLIKPV